jgi:hypothetical protein
MLSLSPSTGFLTEIHWSVIMYSPKTTDLASVTFIFAECANAVRSYMSSQPYQKIRENHSLSLFLRLTV